jgi:hypothetical protein
MMTQVLSPSAQSMGNKQFQGKKESHGENKWHSGKNRHRFPGTGAKDGFFPS